MTARTSAPVPTMHRDEAEFISRRFGYDLLMRLDADTAIGGPDGRFPSTQATLFAAAATGLGPDALERIAALYWKPVYRYIRFKFRKTNEDAKDLTQGFFAASVEREFFTRFDPEKASFRTYIRMAVDRFVANEHASANREKRGGGIEFKIATDKSAATESPEELFEREWRRELFCVAIADLRLLCDSSGKHVYFEIFDAYDLADERPSYAALAQRYGIPEPTVTNYLSWSRRTLRTLVNERLQGVTSGQRELRNELRRIWS